MADVDYSGSTGYGRAYRERLKGQWGVADVADCCRAAEYLAGRGLVDGDKMCIDGGSAGGCAPWLGRKSRAVGQFRPVQRL